jgi:hypothetical protein
MVSVKLARVLSTGILLGYLEPVRGQCNGITAPVNGGLGDCAADGTLDDGGWCTLTCDDGYDLKGGHPQCVGGMAYPACVDDPGYSNAHPAEGGDVFGCADWAEQDCTTSGFTDLADQVELIAKCPLSCHACIANPGDDPEFVDSAGFACADWIGADCFDDGAVQALGDIWHTLRKIVPRTF